MQEGDSLLDYINLYATSSASSSSTTSTYETTSLAASGPSRAFGGCTIAAALAAASASAPSSFILYSLLGNFLGAATADRILTCTVRSLRDTRTFATRFVEVSQLLDNGERRVCMAALADFQLPEAKDAILYYYSEQPARTYTPADRCPTPAEQADKMLTMGAMTPQQRQAHHDTKPDMRSRSIEQRYCPEGILGQTLSNVGGTPLPHTQDALPMPARTSADWFRSRQHLSTSAAHRAFLAFVLDGPTGWLPLLHDQRPLADFKAVASLEFALRFFKTDIDCNDWHLREIKSTAAGEGRTFFEGKVWDERGRLVASMTQQDIARAKRETLERL